LSRPHAVAGAATLADENCRPKPDRDSPLPASQTGIAVAVGCRPPRPPMADITRRMANVQLVRGKFDGSLGKKSSSCSVSPCVEEHKVASAVGPAASQGKRPIRLRLPSTLIARILDMAGMAEPVDPYIDDMFARDIRLQSDFAVPTG